MNIRKNKTRQSFFTIENLFMKFIRVLKNINVILFEIFDVYRHDKHLKFIDFLQNENDDFDATRNDVEKNKNKVANDVDKIIT